MESRSVGGNAGGGAEKESVWVALARVEALRDGFEEAGGELGGDGLVRGGRTEEGLAQQGEEGEEGGEKVRVCWKNKEGQADELADLVQVPEAETAWVRATQPACERVRGRVVVGLG